ncbi:MAG: hypothetical protein O2820_26895 [Planctomycetota bacterium]|nr:hypothetical protein [Planctomycetota bacterium]
MPRLFNELLMLFAQTTISRQFMFQGLAGSFWFWATLLTCVAAVAMIVMLLRYERQLVPTKVGNTLLCLRILVIAVLLFTFLQPVATWVTQRDQSGRIIVSVDVSRSMETSDTYAGKGELLRWARALEMIGNDTINDRLDGWIESYENGEEPKWVDESEAAAESRRAELAELRKQNVEEVLEAVRKMPRREIAQRLLTGTQSPLLVQLRKIGEVEVRLFATRSESVDDSALGELIKQDAATLFPSSTDITDAALKASSSPGSKVIGAVVLTDGQHNSGRDPVEAAQRLGTLGTPVVPVMIGSEERPRDLAVISLDYPQVVFKKDTPLLRARIAADGFRGEEITVNLEHSDGTVETTTAVVPRAGTGPAIVDVDFPLEADEVGRKEFTLKTEIRPKETRKDNNERKLAIRVVEDKSRVLVVEGDARWEFRFIDNAMSRDERIELSHVLFEQPYLGVLPEGFFPKRLDLPADPADLSDSAFADIDLMVIGDVAPERFSEAAWQSVETFVRDEGGTVVLMAGKDSFPVRHRSDSVLRLLPMRNLRVADVTVGQVDLAPEERGFHLRLTPEGERQSMLQFDTDPPTNREIWSGLPGHSWGLLGEARPGASVFAAAHRSDDASLQEERENAVIVHQYYGFGQVLWIGIDSTWRWRHRVGDKYHHRFWGQLARWAAENKASAGNDFVRLSLDKSQIDVGEDGLVRTRWQKSFLDLNPNMKAFVEIRRQPDDGGAPFAKIEMIPVDGQPLSMQARLAELPVGSWQVKLVADGANLGADDLSTALYIHDSQTTELSDLAANRDLLSQIAEASGGELLTPDRIQRIVELLKPPEEETEAREETTLWDHWLVLVVFFVLLTTEWTIRKLNGLP